MHSAAAYTDVHSSQLCARPKTNDLRPGQSTADPLDLPAAAIPLCLCNSSKQYGCLRDANHAHACAQSGRAAAHLLLALQSKLQLRQLLNSTINLSLHSDSQAKSIRGRATQSFGTMLAFSALPSFRLAFRERTVSPCLVTASWAAAICCSSSVVILFVAKAAKLPARPRYRLNPRSPA
jgi:hypothetical protein